MRILLSLIVLAASVSGLLAGKLPPLGVKDVGLMLRSGYPAKAVEADLQARHFLGPIDAAAEKTLVDSGATADLIGKLKSGVYAVPATEIEAAKNEIAVKAQRQAQQAEEAKKFNTLYQNQLARQQAAAAAAAANPPAPGSIVPLLKGDLVTSKNGVLQTFNDQPLEKKKLIALYFSAKWCPSCRKFTPVLVDYYNRISAAHPEFELVFVSGDRSAPAMEAFMRDTQMPWPAVKFEKIGEKAGLLKYAGKGIPCLVLLDADGRVVSDSYQGETFLGPGKVLADLDKIFGGAGSAPLAQQR